MNGNKDEQTIDEQENQSKMTEFAKWLSSNAAVLEIAMMESWLPKIETTNSQFTLDAGVWFLCRVDVPIVEDGITTFVREPLSR